MSKTSDPFFYDHKVYTVGELYAMEAENRALRRELSRLKMGKSVSNGGNTFRAKKLRKQWINSGLSLREVAKRMRIAAGTLSKLEQGKCAWDGVLMKKFKVAIRT